MRKITVLVFLLHSIWAWYVSDLKINDWWIIRYSLKATICASSKIPKDSLIYGESPDYVLKFTVVDIDTLNYVIKAETPIDLLEKKSEVALANYPCHKLYVRKSSFTLISTEKSVPVRDIKGSIGYSKSVTCDPFSSTRSTIIAFAHSIWEIFTIPMIFSDLDSIFIPGLPPESLVVQIDSVWVTFEPADGSRPIIQKSQSGVVKLKKGPVRYKKIQLTQGTASVEQIWVAGFPWWLFHKSKLIKAELINSSFCSADEIKEIKELIKKDLRKKRNNRSSCH